jgi:lipoprotein-anchoring transpeptidase ErfK/SrfK
VAVTRDGSWAIDGVMREGSTRWVSASTLIPTSHYRATVTYADGGDHVATKTLTFAAADSGKHLKATLSPGAGNVVGIGSPVIVSLSRAVPENQRALVQNRLSVDTSPAVVGAWHWMNGQELHWRPPTYWKPGTKVTISSNLAGLNLGGGVWGSGVHTTSFRVGPSHISRVDVARHQMYVYENRRLIGVHITFEKSQVVTMDSATVGIPRNSPDGYYEKVYWDVRISYGGAFVHAAPWSVGQQGVVNVSHGCVNLSTANATWFYYWSLHGDVVDVYNSPAAPDLADPGMADWNYSWSQWLAGDASPTPAAQALHPRTPRDSEPSAPAYTPTRSSGSSGSSGSTHHTSPSPSPTPRHTHSPTPSPTPRRH